ncbi:small polypeptide DEVIL 14-like [Impatiens glandulifera]|uniref:small polypeptide DEVIL 14-like n=1 Tax=Impatiens glandulifera TaxID=253017 RepID=UPI001FB1892E|nr:small polypeptide DEVIL 14-like [Impatiens glandulifera]
MALNSSSSSSSSLRSFTKMRTWQRCSKQIREQRARIYIIWRCTVLLLSWQD